MADMIASVPLKRAGTVDEVAQAILFVASDKASFLTGQALVVDGGQAVAFGAGEAAAADHVKRAACRGALQGGSRSTSFGDHGCQRRSETSIWPCCGVASQRVRSPSRQKRRSSLAAPTRSPWSV